jgi:hypothetical protein
MKNQKSSFWQALVLTVAVFIIGIFLGIAYEGGKLDEINEYYALSEISLMDSLGLNKIVGSGQLGCEIMVDSNLDFADKIYTEALLLEKYDGSGKLTNNLKVAHRRYDLLRTILWINTMEIPKECKNDLSVVVYLYEFQTEDLVKRATQKVWSRVLFDLKQEKGKEVLLIPIAVDSDIVSLDALLKRFEISKFPAVVIDEEHVIDQVSSVEDLKKYLQ